MEIRSPAFDNEQFIPVKYTCEGENVSPPLEFIKIPKMAKSLVLLVHAPDTPMGDWIHWLVWNISPDVFIAKEGSAPLGGIEAENDFRLPGYRGPCPPPHALHEYHFRLYALDEKLSFSRSEKKNKIIKAAKKRAIEEALLVGVFKGNAGMRVEK